MTRLRDEGRLPVDPDRLRQEFPDLTDDDLEAYVTVTRRLLADPQNRGRRLQEIMERGRAARETASAEAALSPEQSLALRYLIAVEKMQRPLAGKR